MNEKLLQFLPKPIKISKHATLEIKPYVAKPLMLPKPPGALRPTQMMFEGTKGTARRSFKKMLNRLFWALDIGATLYDAQKLTSQELELL